MIRLGFTSPGRCAGCSVVALARRAQGFKQGALDNIGRYTNCLGVFSRGVRRESETSESVTGPKAATIKGQAQTQRGSRSSEHRRESGEETNPEAGAGLLAAKVAGVGTQRPAYAPTPLPFLSPPLPSSPLLSPSLPLVGSPSLRSLDIFLRRGLFWQARCPPTPPGCASPLGS